MVWSEPFLRQHLPSGIIDQIESAVQIKHMMMDEALLVIVPVTLPMLCYCIGDRIFLVIPESDKLLHVSHVVLAHIAGIIFTQMLKGSHRAAIVKSAVF